MVMIYLKKWFTKGWN